MQPAPNPTAAKPACTPGPPVPLRVELGFRVVRVAAIFCAVVTGVMLVAFFRYQQAKPLDDPEVIRLKAELVKNPQDIQLKQQIQAADLKLRQSHDRYLSVVHSGQWLLAGGALVLLASLQTAIWRKRLCILKKQKKGGEDARALLQASAGVIGVGVFVILAAWWLAGSTRTSIPAAQAAASPGATNGSPAVVASLPTAEEIRTNWGRFRGPDGNGIALATNLPLAWDVTSGSNVLWKTPVPATGFNSPIVWGGRVFLSAGDPTNREVLCFDAATGKELWRKALKNVPNSPAQPPEVPEQTGFAAATMATDGKRAYAIFANHELGAFGLDGSVAWSKYLGESKNPHGHATSLLTWQDKLVLQLDQGESEDKLSKLLLLEGATGKPVWQVTRPVGSSWATPILIEAAGKTQIITLAVPWVIAYAITDGKELWRVEGLGGEVTPSPIFAGGKVIVLSPSEKMLAIKPDGQGDVTKTHVAWKSEDNIPDIGSPVSNGELIFMLTTGGMMTCVDASDGKKVWEHDYGMDCHASLSLVGNRVVLFGNKGGCVMVEAGRAFKELARSDFGEPIYASPAFVGDRMFVRTAKSMFCIGASVR